MGFAAGNDDLIGGGPSPVQLFYESVLARIEMHFRDGGVTPNAHLVDVGTESFRILLSTHHANAEDTRRVGEQHGAANDVVRLVDDRHQLRLVVDQDQAAPIGV